MATEQDLLAFVRQSLEQGISRNNIELACRKAGWAPQKIRKALASYSMSDWGVAIPVENVGSNARHFGFYLALFISLYVAGYVGLGLFFSLVDVLSTDSPNAFSKYHTKNWFAWTIVFLPVYLVLARQAEKRKLSDPTSIYSGSRLWLTYLTMVIAGLTALITLVILLQSILGGTVTMGVFFKVTAVIVVSIGVLRYYALDMRRTEQTDDSAAVEAGNSAIGDHDGSAG